MKILWIVLIVIGALILFGPIMLFFAKINKVDPYILEKSNEEILKDEKSFVLVNILKPLFVPLWIETKILRWIGIKK
jgi:hypothetical protein